MIDDTPGSSRARDHALLGFAKKEREFRRLLKMLLAGWEKIHRPDEATREWIERVKLALEEN